MSGVAIIVKGCDFSSSNLGQVTFEQNIDVTGISINQSGSIIGESQNLTITYTPSNTNQKGVNWSITSGGEYATISNTGLLTINSNANNSQVVVKAVSQFDESVTDTKTFNLTYSRDFNINEPDIVGNSITWSVTATDGEPIEVSWQLEEGSDFVEWTDQENGEMQINASGDIKVRATAATGVYKEKTYSVTYIEPKSVELNWADDFGAPYNFNGTGNKSGSARYTYQCTPVECEGGDNIVMTHTGSDLINIKVWFLKDNYTRADILAATSLTNLILGSVTDYTYVKGEGGILRFTAPTGAKSFIINYGSDSCTITASTKSGTLNIRSVMASGGTMSVTAHPEYFGFSSTTQSVDDWANKKITYSWE